MRTSCSSGKLEIVDCMTAGKPDEIKKEVLAGLTAGQKCLPSKYFYDSRGSALFEQICKLPEYYQTRSELSILEAAAGTLMQDMNEGNIIDLGSGANWKIRVLLDAVRGSLSAVRYVPVDVCAHALKAAAADLMARHPGLNVTCVIADLTGDFDRFTLKGKKLFTFFGSTIGNFHEEQAAVFLEKIAKAMEKEDRDRLLLGMDLIKDKKILEAAYNDGQGVTAAFNLNILSFLNRELRTSFDPGAFDHLAFYNQDRRQVEMHLRANRDIRVPIECLDHEVRMKKGETILTEICRKYSRKAAEDMAAGAGLRISRWMTDAREWFALAEVVSARR